MTNIVILAAGLDSLSAVELRNVLQEQLGLELPGTLMFDYPTVAALIAYLTNQLTLAAPPGVLTCSADDNAENQTAQIQVARSTDKISQQAVYVTVNATVARLSCPAIDSMLDSSTVTPLCRWDVDAFTKSISHRPGSRFGRYVSSYAHLLDG